MPLQNGQILNDRYTILNVIAEGGMGAIYYGQDTSLGVEVAIKENLFSSEEASHQFRKEATMLAKLRHPNLPRVTDHFILPGQGQYLVMDFIHGDDLKQHIQAKGHLSESEVIRIGISICDALTYLHTRVPAIIHRDVKPGNIKLAPNGQVFLVDFGLARFFEDGEQTTTGAQSLTPGFAPPEQYGKGTDTRSDIYSLGATLYNALTGKLPEDGLARAMGTAVLTPLQACIPEINPATANVIEKAVEITPSLRYRSAEAFKQALLNTPSGAALKPPALNSQPPGAEQTITSPRQPAPSFSPSTAAPTKRKVPTAAIAIAAVVLLAASAAFLGSQFGLFSKASAAISPSQTAAAPVEVPPTSTPQLPAAVPTQLPPTAEVQAAAPTSEPTLEPTPKATPLGGGTGQIAYASDQSGIPQIWLLETETGVSQPLTNLPDGACQPAWSPDGQEIVFISPCRERKAAYPGASLFIIHADGKGFKPLPSLPGGDFDPAWSPDGTEIAFTSLRDGISHIYSLNLADNSATRLSSPSSSDRSPAWSPDGEKIAFGTTRLGVPQIWIMNRDGTGPKEFSNLDTGAAEMPSWSPNGEIIAFTQGSNQPWLVVRQFNNPSAPEVKVSDLRPAWDTDFSEDGYWLVFETDREGSLDLYRMTLNGLSLTALTSDPAQEFHPAVRPAAPSSDF